VLRLRLPHVIAVATLIATTATQSKPVVATQVDQANQVGQATQVDQATQADQATKTAQERAPQERLGGVLPAIGTVGNAPSQATYAIELHHNGLLSVKGLPVTFDECFQQLADYTKNIPGLRIDRNTTSLVNVLIRADRSVPMAAIDRMLRECMRRDISAPRIFFGATLSGTKNEGAFAYFLPVEFRDGASAELIPVIAMPGKPGTVDGLENYLFRYQAAMEPEQRRTAAVSIETQGDVAWGTALSTLDAAARAGIPTAYLSCKLTAAQSKCWFAKATKRDLRALQLASPATIEVGCQIGPITVLQGPQKAIPVRVQDGFAGYPWSPVLAAEPIKEEIETPIGGAYDNRNGEARGKEFRPKASQAIDDSLKWLMLHQDQDGKWDSDRFMKHDKGAEICGGAGNAVHDVGVTGLALLALLGDGNTMRVGPYRDQVKLAAKWLRSQQHDNGRFGSNASHDFIYDHAIAAYAMAEAYGLSDDKMLKRTAQKAINYLESHRNSFAVWRYQPCGGDNDTSVSNWCAMAYITGCHFGLQVNEHALQRVGIWLDAVADPVTGHHGYTKKGEPSSRHAGNHIKRFPLGNNEALTGSSLFVRYMLGQNMEKHPIMQTSAERIHSQPPKWLPGAGNIDFYAWYWCSDAMHQVGGRHWHTWSTNLDQALLTGQEKTGAAKGSWAPIGVWGEDGGRIASTALATLSLQSHYRYARLIR
jgi:hypothetical protein